LAAFCQPDEAESKLRVVNFIVPAAERALAGGNFGFGLDKGRCCGGWVPLVCDESI